MDKDKGTIIKMAEKEYELVVIDLRVTDGEDRRDARSKDGEKSIGNMIKAGIGLVEGMGVNLGGYDYEYFMARDPRAECVIRSVIWITHPKYNDRPVLLVELDQSGRVRW